MLNLFIAVLSDASPVTALQILGQSDLISASPKQGSSLLCYSFAQRILSHQRLCVAIPVEAPIRLSVTIPLTAVRGHSISMLVNSCLAALLNASAGPGSSAQISATALRIGSVLSAAAPQPRPAALIRCCSCPFRT